MSRPRTKDLSPATAPKMLPPNTHFMTRGSLQPALCVLGGKLELGTTVTTVYQLLRLGQIPTEPRGVVPTGRFINNLVKGILFY